MLLIKLCIISYPWTQPFICCSESFRLKLCKHHIFPLPSGSILGSIHRKQCGRWVDERNTKELALPHSPCCASGYHCHAFYPGIASCLQFLVFSSIPRKGLIDPVRSASTTQVLESPLSLESEKQAPQSLLQAPEVEMETNGNIRAPDPSPKYGGHLLLSLSL